MSRQFCEACREAAADVVGLDAVDADNAAAEWFMVSFGSEMVDHVCESVEYPEDRCDCGCRRLRDGSRAAALR